MLAVAVVVGVGVAAFAFRGRVFGNPWGFPAQQIEVERNGLLAQARILDCNDLETVAKGRSTVHRCSFVFEVYLPNAAPYRVQCEQWVTGYALRGDAGQGNVVPVRVDPRNPQVVFIDISAIDYAKKKREAAEREAHARRQAELLAGGKR